MYKLEMESMRTSPWIVISGLALGAFAIATSSSYAQTATPTPSRTSTRVASSSPAVATPATPCSAPLAQGETAVRGFIPAPNGSVTIPELGATVNIVNNCYEFRRLTLPRSPMLVSFAINADSLQPATFANELVLTTGSQAIFSPVLHQGSVPERVDPCPTLLQMPQQQLSAAEH